MSKVYYFRDMRLIKNSKIIEDHILLSEVFKEYPELKDTQLKKLSKKVQLFLNNIYPKIRLETINEWEIDYSKRVEILDRDKKIKCQLCNHDIMNVCYIKNKFNNNILKVGIECVKHFEFKGKMSLGKILQEQKNIKRLEKLNLQVPNIERIIERWNLVINQQPIYIKESVKAKYLKIGQQIEVLYSEYINKKNITIHRESEIIYKINELLRASEKEKQGIIVYSVNNKNNKLIPTKEIIRYLERIDDIQGINWIKEDGEIKNRTLYRIKDKEYVKQLIPDFNNVLSKSGIMIKSTAMYDTKLGYSVSVKCNPNLKLFCKYSEMAMEYGGIITGEETFLDINQSEIIKMGNLKNAESIEFALESIENILNTYSIKYEEFYYNFNEMLWVKKRNGKEYYYILTKLNELNILLKEVAYKIKKYKPKDLYDIIMKNSTKLSNSDAKELKKNRDKMIV